MNKINYQIGLDRVIASLNGKTPSLLLHSCCAPCSSYVIEYLSKYFDITVLYSNLNMNYTASLPFSPVRILITSKTSETNIFPSPTSPVLAFSVIVSNTVSRSSSLTINSKRVFGIRSIQ